MFLFRIKPICYVFKVCLNLKLLRVVTELLIGDACIIIIETLSVTSSVGTFCLVSILQGIFVLKYNCMTCMLMLVFVLFNTNCCKENMRKLLRASKPNPSLVSYLALILD